MNRTLKHVLLTDIISFALIISILGCSLAWEAPKNPKIEEREMIPVVARILDEQRNCGSGFGRKWRIKQQQSIFNPKQ